MPGGLNAWGVGGEPSCGQVTTSWRHVACWLLRPRPACLASSRLPCLMALPPRLPSSSHRRQVQRPVSALLCLSELMSPASYLPASPPTVTAANCATFICSAVLTQVNSSRLLPASPPLPAVTAANCGDLATQPDIDGFLVRAAVDHLKMCFAKLIEHAKVPCPT